MNAASPVPLAEQPVGTIPRGIAAGAVACLIAVPVTPLTWLIATVMKGTLYRKVMHQSVSYDELHRHGREALIAGSAVAGTTGLIAAAIAAGLALTLVKRGHRAAFLSTAGIGVTLAAMVAWRVMTVDRADTGSATLAVLIGWAMAVAGLYLTELTLATPDHRTGRR